MLNKICAYISQNKNTLMLVSSAIYAFAILATLSDNLALFMFLFLALFIFLLIKELFPVKYVIVWSLLFVLGIVNTSLRIRDVDELLNLAPMNSEITGTILSIPQGDDESKQKFFFKVDKIKFEEKEINFKNEKVLVTTNSPTKIEGLNLYNSGTLKGRLSAPFKAGNPSQFDYGNYLRNHDAYAVFYAKEFIPIDSTLSLKQKMMQAISNYREKILEIHSKYLPSPNLEILGGIVFGDDAVSPPKDVKQSFVSSGLLHILAASGMNVAFIFGFFSWIFSLLKINYRLNIILGMIMVCIYTLMTGLGASIIRAAGMLLFVLFGKLIDRDANSISLLSFVGLLMLLYNPLFIQDVGFQLSFIVTFGILLMTPTIIRADNKIIDYVIGTVTIPVIAQLWVIPVQIFYFNNISIYSVFANIMSVPILAVLSFGGFVSSLLSAIAPIADYICMAFDFVLNPLLTLLINISDFWGHMPNSMIQTAHPSVLQIVMYYLILVCFTGFIYKEIREKYFKKIFLTMSALLIILLISTIPIKNSNLEIITFDVGNADCFLIKTPNNDYAMIDTGRAGYKGGKSQAEIIVLKYLKDRGIKKLDTLIITHFDNDHCGGAVDVLKNLKVKNLYLNDLNHASIAADRIYKIAKKNNTQIYLAENKQVIYEKSKVKLTNLLGSGTSSDNENSIITLLEYKDFTMLFTGDAGINGLKEILEYVPENITVLKVPHHGAIDGLDNDIVKYLNPEYSIISVGENKFGHPAFYTLSLLKNSNILRTDVNNSILIKVSKKGFRVLTYDLKRRKYLLSNK